MPGRGRFELSRQLQVIAALLFLTVLAVVAHQIWDTRGALIAETEQQMARLDMVFAEQTGRALEGVDLVVHAAADTFGNDPATAKGGNTAYAQMLARRAGMVRQMLGIAILDSTGAPLYGAPAALDAVILPPPVRASVAAVIAERPDHLTITGPFKMPDGAWSALLLRPAPSAGGTVQYAAAAFLNLFYFEDFYKAVELTDNGAILLHRRDGTVLARYPHNEQVVGQSYGDLPPFRDVLSKQIAGTLLMDSPLDGERRILAIRALKAFPVAVNISVGEREVLRIWRRQALTFGIAAFAVGLLLLSVLLQLARRTRQVERLVVDLQAAKEAAEAANRRITAEMEERERAEAALRQAQRAEAIGQITGGVAHDFNNLLAIVMGNIDLLESVVDENSRAFGWLATMRSAVERGATLTAQLLAFSRRQPLMPRPTDLNQLITGLRDLVQSALGTRTTLSLAMQPDLGLAMIDKAQIELVILNLAINARDAMPEGGTVAIETRRCLLGPREAPDDLPPGEYILLAVRDTGTGMPADVARRAFEPFFTTKPVGRGSGLGLSQAYGTVRQLGGTIRIESRPGEGTSILVYLQPAAANDAGPQAAAPMRRNREARRRRVLLVDDDHPVRATIAAVLTHRGYEVVEASGGDEALDLLESEPPPDVLLTDVVMPQMTGPELARRVRLRWPGLPVVFISGYTDPNALAGQGGLLYLVRKPARPEELMEAIELAIEAVGAV
ncbi:MAG TPA: response regulator [Acetobacteraceae bacterium]|nr:response regulator [Acetobacteraceae bacterium]